MLDPRVEQGLDLRRHGFAYAATDIATTALSAHGDHLVLKGAYGAEIDGSLSRKDREPWGELRGRLMASPTMSALVPLPVGTKVAVAIRPEKIAISRTRPENCAHAVSGVVFDLGYFGKDSLYRVQLPTGHILSVSSVNARRAVESERVAQWEDHVWLSFEPSSVLLLAED
jgi:putrescine transport system ATP-binding protein